MAYLIVFLLFIAILIYFTFMSGGAKKEYRECFYGYYFAEDGVTSPDDVPNSINAFKNCIDNGVGIKTSVIMSADQQIFIAHKYDLKEEFGVDRDASACTAQELIGMGLIPVARLLELTGNKVPVILEIQIAQDYRAMCRNLSEVIKLTGRKNIAIACFSPGVVAWFKHTEKGIMRAIISAPAQDFKSLSKAEAFMTGNLAYNAICRPQIILYRDKPESKIVKFVNNIGGISGVWTITTPEVGKEKEAVKDVIICREFMPENPHFKFIEEREISQAEKAEDERLERKRQRREAREQRREEREIEKTGVTARAKKSVYFFDDEEFAEEKRASTEENSETEE